MAKVRRVARCYHCGTILQDIDPNGKGYCPKEHLQNEVALQDRILYCQKCYDLFKDLNSGSLNQNVDEKILDILDNAVATDSLIVWVVDLFDFNGTIKKTIVEKVKNLRVAVIGTKCDLLRPFVKEKQLEEFLEYSFKEAGINPVYVKAVGGKEEEQYKDLFDKCLKGRHGRDVYVIGYATSGKSTLLNRILRFYDNPTRKSVRVINYPKTEVEVLRIPLSNTSDLYELPGIDLDISVIDKVENDVRKLIIPKKEVKMHKLNLFQRESVVIGNLAAYSLLEGKNGKLNLFVSDKVEVKKIKYDQLDKYLPLLPNEKQIRPYSKRMVSFHDYEVFEYKMENDKKMHDISIEGLGWITFKGEGQLIQIMLPKGVAIKESLSKVK